MASTTVAHPSSSTSMGPLSSSFSKLGKLSPVIEQPSEEMKEQQLPEHLKTFQAILESIGFLNNDASIFAQLRSMFAVAEEASLTHFDHSLAHLFKCDDYHHDCYFSGTETAFRHHLEEKHSDQNLYCFYCTKSGHHEGCTDDGDHASYSQADQLINHIKEQHGNAAYQCNLCFYRGFSADHVFIHQAFEHLSNWEATLKRAILDKKGNGSLTPIEEQFLLQTSDDDDDNNEDDDEDDDDKGSEDDTEVENSDDESVKVSSNVKISKNSAKELCKIICCDHGAQSDDLDSVVREYFTKHAVVLDSRNLEKYSNLSKVLCAYCQPSQAVSNENFLSHAVSAHSSFPILAYDLSSGEQQQQQQSPIKYSISDLGNESVNAEAIVSDFRQQLAENALPRSFDDILMQSAFAFYSTLDHKESKGTKRKLDADDAAALSAGGSPSKRARFVTRYLTKSNLKQVGRFVGTAIVAIGFYQLSHYLPESFQPYLN